MKPAIELRTTCYDHRDARELVRELEAEQLTRYSRADPPEADPSDYEPSAGLFLVAYGDQQPVACGGYRQHTLNVGEIKKMYVRPSHRGHGIGRLILGRLEEHATKIGVHRILLETGIRNLEALHLYTQAGYARITSYVPGRDPTINRAFAKDIPPSAASMRAEADLAATSTDQREPSGCHSG